MVPFDADKTIQYWREGAAYDLETGRSLMEAKRFPYTHSLVFLASKTEIEMPDSIMDTLAEFMEFHLEARYPDEKKDFYKRCTEEFARKKFAEGEGVYHWLIQRSEA